MNTLEKKVSVQTVVLLASLAANVFICGLYVGHHHEPGRQFAGNTPPAPNPQEGMLVHMESALGPEDVKIFDQQLRKTLPPPDDAAMEADFKAVRTSLLAEPFSPEVFKQAVQKTHERRNELDQNFVQSLATAITMISADGRHHLADALPMHPPHWGNRPGDQLPEPPPGRDGQDSRPEKY